METFQLNGGTVVLRRSLFGETEVFFDNIRLGVVSRGEQANHTTHLWGVRANTYSPHTDRHLTSYTPPMYATRAAAVRDLVTNGVDFLTQEMNSN